MRAGQDGEGAEDKRAAAQRHPHRPSRRAARQVEVILVRHRGVGRVVAGHDSAEIARVGLGLRAQDRRQHGDHGGRDAHRRERWVGQHAPQKGDPPRIVVGAKPRAADGEGGVAGRIRVEPAEVLRHRQRVAAQGVDPIARHERAAEHISIAPGALAGDARVRAWIRDAQRDRRAGDRPLRRARGASHRHRLPTGGAPWRAPGPLHYSSHDIVVTIEARERSRRAQYIPIQPRR